MYGLLFTLFVVVAITSFIHRRFGRFVYLTWKIPGPSMWELITIHAKRLLSDKMLDHMWTMCASNKFKPWGFWAYQHFVVLVSDPDTVSEVLKNKNFYNKASLLYPEAARYLGQGLITLNSDEYRRHRKLLYPVFRRSRLESGLPMMNEMAVALVEDLRQVTESARKAFDIGPILDYRVLKISSASLFDGLYVDRDPQRLLRAVRCAKSVVQINIFNPFYYWFLKTFSSSFGQTLSMIQETRQDIQEYYRKKITELVPLSPGEKPSSLKEVLMELQSDEERGLRGEECVDEAITIGVAATETASIGMSLVLLMLALHQDVQQRAFEELESIFGQNHRSVEVEDITKMVYLDMVIKEVLRLFPPAPIIGRNVEEETDLNEVVLPKGASVFVNIFALHRNPNIFTDPLKFDPERFYPERSKERHPYSYIPFGSGFRTCPGDLHAMIVLKTFLCHILRNLKVFPSDGIKSMDDIHVKMEFVLALSERSLRFVSRE